jgi:hypothetical protein
VNAASVQLFGAALDASDFARVTGKQEVIDHEKKHASIFSFAACRFGIADHGK